MLAINFARSLPGGSRLLFPYSSTRFFRDPSSFPRPTHFVGFGVAVRLSPVVGFPGQVTQYAPSCPVLLSGTHLVFSSSPFFGAFFPAPLHNSGHRATAWQLSRTDRLQRTSGVRPTGTTGPAASPTCCRQEEGPEVMYAVHGGLFSRLCPCTGRRSGSGSGPSPWRAAMNFVSVVCVKEMSRGSCSCALPISSC